MTTTLSGAVTSLWREEKGDQGGGNEKGLCRRRGRGGGRRRGELMPQHATAAKWADARGRRSHPLSLTSRVEKKGEESEKWDSDAPAGAYKWEVEEAESPVRWSRVSESPDKPRTRKKQKPHVSALPSISSSYNLFMFRLSSQVSHCVEETWTLFHKEKQCSELILVWLKVLFLYIFLKLYIAIVI